MLQRALLLFLFLIPVSLPAQSNPVLSPFHWHRQSDYLPQSAAGNSVKIYYPSKTSVSLNSKKQYDVTLPFIIENTGQIVVKALFNLPDSLSDEDFYFFSGGSGQTAAITVNGYVLGTQLNDLTPLKIHIPKDALHAGKDNTVLLRLNNPKELNEGFPRLPFLLSERDFCGVLRPFLILGENASLISNFKAGFQNGRGIFNFKLNLPPAENDFLVEVQLKDERTAKTIYKRLRRVPPNHKALGDQFAVANASLWNTQNPVLLQAIIKIKQKNRYLDERIFKFGLRAVSSSKNRLLLNGRQITVRGLNYHLNPQRWLGKDVDALLLQDLSFIKKSGFNAVRLPHYIPNERFLQITDSLGLLVFAELPVWRYPESFFKEDIFLENTKNTLRRIQRYYGLHPSLAAIGLGQEIPLSSSAAQKFMFILQQLVKNNMSILTYIAPVPEDALPVDKVSDFYLLDIYKPLNKSYFEHPEFFTQTALYGHLGFFTEAELYDWQNPALPLIRQKLWAREWLTVKESHSLQGGFFESFQDWQMNLPLDFTINSKQPTILSGGIYTFNHLPRPGASDYAQIWDSSSAQNIQTATKKKKTNFFAILLFFSAVIFFVFYRSRPRLRENFNRALRHPYGFYVDLRERRIIPMMNSILVGGFAALIMAAHLASLLYFFRHSLRLQETAAFILRSFGLFENFLTLNSNPYQMTVFLFLIFLIFPFALSFAIKIISFFSRERIRFRQIMAIALWSGLPVLFMLPFSFINYHALFALDSPNLSLYVFFLFVLWAHIRIMNGIRVLFITRLSKVFGYMLLSYIIPLLILFAVLKPVVNGLDYLQLILHAGALF